MEYSQSEDLLASQSAVKKLKLCFLTLADSAPYAFLMQLGVLNTNLAEVIMKNASKTFPKGFMFLFVLALS